MNDKAGHPGKLLEIEPNISIPEVMNRSAVGTENVMVVRTILDPLVMGSALPPINPPDCLFVLETFHIPVDGRKTD